MKLLVLGARGQLARHLAQLRPDATLLGREALDLGADAPRIQQTVLAQRPDVIINAAAYTAVDGAETERELAWKLNAEAPAALARAAQHLGVPLVHVSTDYVFDGTAKEPYRETDAVAPLNVYGRTKLAGELAVASLCERHWILRTSWVFSELGNNFPKTMLKLARAGRTLRVVDDQWGRPTHAGDLARMIVALVSKDADGSARLPHGVYHATGGPVVTWHRFAESTLELAAAEGYLTHVPQVSSVSTRDYVAGLESSPAPRPARAVLESSKLLASLHVDFNWERGLQQMVRQLRLADAGAN